METFAKQRHGVIDQLEGIYEQLVQSGVRAGSPVALMACAGSRRAEDVDAHESAARKLLQRLGIERVSELSRADLLEEFGLEEFEAMRLLCAVELGRRAGGAARGVKESFDRPEDAYRYFEHLRGESKEHFCAAFLNSKNGLISVRTIHIGTINLSVVGAREVFREAVREGAASLIVAHNHPSGDPTPSDEDIAVTRRLVEAGKLLDIPLLDHVIIGDHRNVSLRREGAI